MKALALQGGGILGYGQSIILSELERVAQKPCAALFDIMGGTSVGAIIAAHLSIGITPNNIQSFFVSDAPNIFHSYWYSKVTQLWGAKYSADGIESALQDRLKNFTLKDCQTKLLITSYDWASDRPVYFKSYEKSSISKDWIVIGYDEPIQLWQIARCSSAAQTYFPAFKYKDLVLMDGGNTGDNAPDVLTISEAAAFTNIPSISMFSLGAGDTNWNKNADSMVNPSAIMAGINTIDVVFSAGESSDVYKASNILSDRYFRMSPNLGNGYAIDDASDTTLTNLRVAAQNLINSPNNLIKPFLAK